LGVRLCLDDFGAGWSSLQHLTTFPVQELKIDPTFISAIAPGKKDLEVVRSLVALAHTLGLEVTAEGLERAEQWRLLEEAGCDGAQGYYIGSPMEPDALLDFLEDLERGSCPVPRVAPRRHDLLSASGDTRSRETSVPVWASNKPLCNEEP
jgi:EAL domain-containing protein (putative c-di-GMP-specific phosphodiesterase class I)